MIEKVDFSKCRGCRVCVDYCPEDVLRLDTTSSEFPSCQGGCPAGADIRRYMYQLNQGDLNGAAESISESLPMPAITGRVCAHPCEIRCARKDVDEAVNIASVERFLGDMLFKQKATAFPQLHAKRIAVIGSGPAGLSAADFLVRRGFPVTVFESQPLAGGMLRYGIPEYHLPRKVLEAQLSYMEGMGIEFINGITYGKELSFDELKGKGFRAIIIATPSATGETADTSINKDAPELFACVETVGMTSTVIGGIASGRKAAARVKNYLTGFEERNKPAQTEVNSPPGEGMSKMPRIQSPVLSIRQRKNIFKEIKSGFTEDMALMEAARCMTCGSKAYIAYHESCMTCYNCEISCPDGAINVDPMRKVMPVLIRHPGDKTNYDAIYTERNNYVPLNRR